MPIPQDVYQHLATYLATHQLSVGLGTREAACSVAAINLALTGRLTDEIPDCMSLPIGGWIIGIQDAMPDYIRNGDQWKALLPEAAGTGRDREADRTRLIVDWMWDDVLPQLLPVMRKWGVEAAWQEMLSKRNIVSAQAAWEAVTSVSVFVVDAVENAATVIRYALGHSDFAARRAAEVAGDVAFSIRSIKETAPLSAYWDRIDPCGLLYKLITI